ncbi:MAG: phytase [Bacteroidales bacterium]|nr:phytase [Bacteroidales bacterium]MCF8387369.1 phytase [Bacteroidales bacterium]MCF8397847.1 phytase [Bacteroidales bacterium]
MQATFNLCSHHPFFLLFLIFLLYSCEQTNHKNKNGKNGIAEVHATVETESVKHSDDAADDPAIWYNAKKPEKSIVYGSDKQGGIYAYDLDGRVLFYKEVGRINNIDIRYNFPLESGEVDILGGSNRSDNTIVLYRIDPDSGFLLNVLAKPIQSRVREVYGFALQHDPDSNLFYALVNDKSGQVEQWELMPGDANTIDCKLVRTFNVGGQTEGMVVDDYLNYLYIGQENKGIWKYHADPYHLNNRVLIDDTSSKFIKADIEGLCIYHADSINGYLIASIQGMNTFAIYERRGINKYIGSFRIVKDGLDGVSETDGIEVLNMKLGDKFPEGVLVVQDGFNHEGDALKNQNYKFIPWQNIANAYDPELLMENTYFPY